MIKETSSGSRGLALSDTCKKTLIKTQSKLQELAHDVNSKISSNKAGEEIIRLYNNLGNKPDNFVLPHRKLLARFTCLCSHGASVIKALAAKPSSDPYELYLVSDLLLFTKVDKTRKLARRLSLSRSLSRSTPPE